MQSLSMLSAEQKKQRGYQTMPLGLAMQAIAEKFPPASMRDIYTVYEPATFGSAADLIAVQFSKTVVIQNVPVSIVSNRYKLIQHFDAFLPILQGLEQAGVSNIEVNMGSKGSLGWMDVLLDDDVADTVRIGYRVQNSHDGKHSLSYSFGVERVQREVVQVEKEKTYEPDRYSDKPPEDVPTGGYRYFEVVGYRQVCGNGMKVRVPLAEAETGKKGVGEGLYSIGTLVKDIWVEDELRERAQILAQSFTRILHIGKPEAKVEAQRKATELVALLREPAKRLIERARNAKLTYDDLKIVFNSRFSERASQAMLNALECRRDAATAWDAYNAMTNYATHSAPDKMVNSAFDKAADYLVTLVVKAPDGKEAE